MEMLRLFVLLVLLLLCCCVVLCSIGYNPIDFLCRPAVLARLHRS
jgi:hypothetical protein